MNIRILGWSNKKWNGKLRDKMTGWGVWLHPEGNGIYQKCVRRGNTRFLFMLEKEIPVQLHTTVCSGSETHRGRPGFCNMVGKAWDGPVPQKLLEKHGVWEEEYWPLFFSRIMDFSKLFSKSQLLRLNPSFPPMPFYRSVSLSNNTTFLEVSREGIHKR